MKERIHIPVLWKEVLEKVSPQVGNVVVDATLGSGGYTRSLSQYIGSEGILISFDRDKKAIDDFKKSLDLQIFPEMIHRIEGDNMFLIHANYSDIEKELKERNIQKVDSIVADLGISSDQLLDKEKGLSFLADTPLDMRLDIQEEVETAFDIINSWGGDELIRIFQVNAQEKFSRKIVEKIIERRKRGFIATTKDLSELIESAVPKGFYRIHPATKVFQALRMEVNKEEYHLKVFLEKAIKILRPGGRLAIVSFHSGEDRLVKESFRVNARGCICPPTFPLCRCYQKARIKQIHRKPICPSEEELKRNPRSRSAKLRVIEKIEE